MSSTTTDFSEHEALVLAYDCLLALQAGRVYGEEMVLIQQVLGAHEQEPRR